jgi:NAD(P)-dependent dehydrogenase (short-subunit alcohol dehydrogenase family)
MSLPGDARNGSLAGRVALVSGAAAGIGEAIARRFAEEGAVLWLNDLRPEPLAALVEDLRGAGADATGTPGDMGDPVVVRAWVDAAVVALGRVDVLSNNVGVARPGLVADITDEDWRFQQRTTLDSVFLATRAVLPHMVRQGGGSIVSMASGAGIGGNHNLGAYAAAKAAVINLMETVATEYGPHGVRANAVTPGPTDTAPLRAYIEGRPGGMAAYVADLDLARLSRPEEVANLVLFLASDQSANVTGICLRGNIRAASRRPTGGTA